MFKTTLSWSNLSITAAQHRLRYLDNIKIVLITVVIFVHAAQPYGPGGAWPTRLSVPLPFENLFVVGAFLAVSASFFMGLSFFALRTFFRARSIAKDENVS